MEALYYLVKPVDADKISICMERILARYNEQERQRVILAEAEEYADGKPVSRVTLWLQPEDIVYVEAFSHNTALYTKEKCYLVREGISVWRERLAGGGVLLLPPLLSGQSVPCGALREGSGRSG